MSDGPEAERQRALLQALRQPGAGALPPSALALPGRAGASPGPLAGLQAYRANAWAMAQRALAAAYPVTARLLGDEAMGALARDLWRAHPPTRGDLAWFGAEAADWLAGRPEFEDLPFLPDVARLEWAVHRAATASDPPSQPPDIASLTSGDPAALTVAFVAGHALVDSPWPVLTIWRAHQVAADTAPDLREAQAALAQGRGEAAWVWRRGLVTEWTRLEPGEAAFQSALLAGHALGHALPQVLDRHPDFDFEAWLLRALREGWLAAIRARPTPNHP